MLRNEREPEGERRGETMAFKAPEGGRSSFHQRGIKREGGLRDERSSARKSGGGARKKNALELSDAGETRIPLQMEVPRRKGILQKKAIDDAVKGSICYKHNSNGRFRENRNTRQD